MLYSANDGASAAFNAKSLSGDQGAAQISQCFAVLCSDTSSDGNNGGIGLHIISTVYIHVTVYPEITGMASVYVNI